MRRHLRPHLCCGTTPRPGPVRLSTAVLLVLLSPCPWTYAQAPPTQLRCRELLEAVAASSDKSADAAEQRLSLVPPQCQSTMRLLLQARIALLRSDWRRGESLLAQHESRFNPVANEGERSGQIETDLRRNLIDWKARLKQEMAREAASYVQAAEKLIGPKPQQALALLVEAEKLYPLSQIYLDRAAIGLSENQLREVEEALATYRTQGPQTGTAVAAEQQQYERLNQELLASKEKERQQFRIAVSQLAQVSVLKEDSEFQGALRLFDRAYQQLYWMSEEVLQERLRFYSLANRPLDGLQDLQKNYPEEVKKRPELGAELRRKVAFLRIDVPDDQGARCVLSGKVVSIGTELAVNPGKYVAELQGRETPIIRLAIELSPGERSSFSAYIRAFTQHLDAAVQLRSQNKWKVVAGEYLKTVDDTLPAVPRAKALGMLPDIVFLLAQAYESAQLPVEGIELLRQHSAIPGASDIRGRLDLQLVTLNVRAAKMAQLQIDEQTVKPIDTAAGRVWTWTGNPGEHMITADVGGVTLKGKCGFRSGQRTLMTLRFPETDHPSPLLAIKDNKFLLGRGRFVNLAIGLSAGVIGGVLVGLDARQDCQYGQCARALDTQAAGIATLVGSVLPLGFAGFGLAANSYLNRTQNERVKELSCP